MALPPVLRRSLALIAALLLLALAWTGIRGGVQQLSQQATVPQRIQSALQILYGVSAILMLVTAFTWRQLAVIAARGFVVSLVAAAGLAAVVWGEQSVWMGFVAAIVALAVAGILVWMIRIGVAAASPISKVGESLEG